MAVLPIVTYDDPVLRSRTEAVEEGDPALQKLIEDLFDTMYNAEGVGLAAPQVGVLKSVFVVNADAMFEDEPEGEKPGPMVFINPEIKETGDQRIEMEEGCLSIPGVKETVVRPEKMRIHYQDQDFVTRSLTVDGWLSRVIQHEADHLNGVLFIDHLGSFRRRLLRSQLQQVIEGGMETDYPVANRPTAHQKAAK